MRFTKMQGAGNDFIIINNIEEKIPEEHLGEIAARVCSRRVSVGADGFMAVTEPEGEGDFRMLFFNSDGSPAEMCGNGARCVARYGHDRGLCGGDRQVIETVSGIVTALRRSQRIYTVRLRDASVVRLGEKVMALGKEYEVHYVELGTPGIPHAVLVYPGLDGEDMDFLRKLGREIRYSASFPKGANVTFVRITGEDSLRAVTYERGVEDFTLACGTGCGSAAAALTLLGEVSGRDVRVSMPGGELSVSLETGDGKARDIMLTGPTNLVAEGEILDEDLPLFGGRS